MVIKARDYNYCHLIAGDNYPSVRLWHREGKMVLMDKNNGLGVTVFAANDEDREQEVSSGELTDKALVRMAWRRFAHRPVSYNWQRNPEAYRQLYEKAKDGGDGNVAKMLVYRVPKHRWTAADDDEVITEPGNERDDSSGSGKRASFFLSPTPGFSFVSGGSLEQGGGSHSRTPRKESTYLQKDTAASQSTPQ